MAAVVPGIPVVDFSAMSLELKEPLKTDEGAVKIVADQVFQAFSTIGFVYLKNHGIPQTLIDSVFQTFDNFFSLSTEVKNKYSKKSNAIPNGWDAVEKERNNPERPRDLKESFDIGYFDDENAVWPNAEVPNFQSIVGSFYESITDLSLRVICTIAIGLQMEPDYFTYAFKKMRTPDGGTQLRYNFYPVIQDASKVKPGQIRCGEHTDYGAISLLFQDDIGGLEVRNVDGTFVAATPMKGTVLVNISDLMQRWTADKLKSTIHRVLIPEIEVKRRVPRRSLVLFVDPDNETVIQCLDGSDKYPPITAGDWKRRRLLDGYKD